MVIFPTLLLAQVGILNMPPASAPPSPLAFPEEMQELPSWWVTLVSMLSLGGANISQL